VNAAAICPDRIHQPDRGELVRLFGFERNGAPNGHQLAVGGVEAGDDDLGVRDRAEDAADDDFAGLAVFDLLAG
jgi:hypothetical protein